MYSTNSNDTRDAEHIRRVNAQKRKAQIKRRKRINLFFYLILIICIIVSGVAVISVNATNSKLKSENDKYGSVCSEAEQRAKKAEDEASGLKEKLKDAEESISGLKKELAAKKSEDGAKVCYLTFDDGPSVNTPRLLKILADNNVKATFFVVHSSHKEYLNDIVKQGHAIGLHSYTHDYSIIYSSEKAYYDDLAKINDEVKTAAGVEPKIIRFPGGASNTVSRNYCNGIMSTLVKSTQKKGYVPFDWNVSSGDANGNNVAVSTIMDNIADGGTSVGRAVVLMHDTGTAKETTVEALPKIIKFYKDNGYSFAALADYDSPMLQNVAN